MYDGEKSVPVGTYLERFPRPDLLRLEKRLEDLATGPFGHLAGDILLLSRMRLDEPLEDRTYFGEPSYTWHGSANRDDSRVVSIIAHTGSSGEALKGIFRSVFTKGPSQVDFTPLMLDLLSR